MGFLLQIAGLLTFLPVSLGLYLGETDSLLPLLLTSVAFLGLGFLMNALCERKDLDFKSACTLLVVSFLIMPLIGAMPYVFADSFGNPDLAERFTNAYFESVSGFTTTGFSFVGNTDVLPRSMLLYRSMTELMGGVGIVFLFLVFFSSKKSTANLGNALGIEIIGPNLKRVFFSVFLIYVFYIFVFAGILYMLGFTDVVKTGSFVIDTITGGYQPSIQGFQQYLGVPTRLCVITLMLLGSVNFSFNYHIFVGKPRKAFSKEVLLYLAIIIIGTFLVSFMIGSGILDSLFHVVSMSSSTGYDYINIPLLNETSVSVFVLLMLIGGCTWSMAGGIKVSKIVLLAQSIKHSIRDTLIKEKVITEKTSAHASSAADYVPGLVSIILFAATLFVFSIVFSTVGIPFMHAFFDVASALTTNGISTGAITVGLPTAYKWLVVAAMIIGRVEFWAILIALSPYRSHSKS